VPMNWVTQPQCSHGKLGPNSAGEGAGLPEVLVEFTAEVLAIDEVGAAKAILFPSLWGPQMTTPAFARPATKLGVSSDSTVYVLAGAKAPRLRPLVRLRA